MHDGRADEASGLPCVPAIDEYVPGYEGISRLGIGAPANSPAQILAILKLPNQRRLC